MKRKSQLRWFNAQLGEDIERKAAGGRTILVEMEVCGDCAAELSSAISAAMEARGAV